MPHSTFAYPFEAKIGAWAGDLSHARTGSQRSFLLTPVPDAAGDLFTLDFQAGTVQQAREQRNSARAHFLG